MLIWIVGRAEGTRWEILGAFQDEKSAVSRCYLPADFVAPLEEGAACPDDPRDWPRLRYPRRRERALT